MKISQLLLLADENIERKVIFLLQQSGYDIKYATKGLRNSSLLKVAKLESRILLTHDFDFADNNHYPASSHCGILIVTSSIVDCDKLTELIKNGLLKFNANLSIIVEV